MKPLDIIHSSWLPVIEKEVHQEPLLSLSEKVLPNISFQPDAENIFKVFRMPLKDIKVVLIGQDPYSTPKDAIGLSFVNGTNKVPPSLRNIYKEILDSTGQEGNINGWEQQGIFLLNSALTVETGKPGSHLSYWKNFTENIIRFISYNNPCIWFLWGKMSQKFKSNITNPLLMKDYNEKLIKDLPINNKFNYILEAPHPAAEVYSGGTSGFFGCKHFTYTNLILDKLKKDRISW